MKQIGILSNPRYPNTWDLATLLKKTLSNLGVHVTCSCADFEEKQPSFSSDLDILITLGGDGTMLRAAHLVSREGTPILGIHMGRLGFLAEVRLDDWQTSLKRVLAGDYWIEERAMMRGELERNGSVIGVWNALNEFVVGRSGVSHMVQLATYVDGGYLTTYVADGVIVATATGSTAYALSAGGPILPPNLRNMLLVPICPHLSLDRTIVLAEGASVMIEVESVGEGGVVVDGMEQAALHVADRIMLAASPHVARFVRLYDRRQVYETLLERLKPRKIERPHE